MNICFYGKDTNSEIPEMQKRVFEHFGLEIEQRFCDPWHGHGGEIDRFMSTVQPTDEPIVLWDSDCIPLDKDIINEAMEFARKGGIYAVAQKASHIPDSPIYAGPAFLAFTYATWEKLGKPSFDFNERSDTATELTYAAREKGVDIHLLYPTHVEKELWPLDGPYKFGKGTTYGGRIYHAFYSRKHNDDMFISKCKSIYEQV